ncbi:MAG: hypothetical protein JNM99_19005 [Verrucomicrobiaceae bacterium]|nr:hypothetical protein [Verrucomicrobiaceae bacterium]
MTKAEPWILRVLAVVFGGTFVYAGVVKALDPGLFLIDVRSFDMLPDPYAAWLSISLPWLEIFAGLAVVIGVFRASGLLILNVLLVVFFIAIGWAWHRGIDIKCGCFGKSDAASNYTWLFTRDGILLALGAVTSWLEIRRLRKS